MMVNPLSVFKLEGFADAPHDETSNLRLSGHRGLTVARYLEAIMGDAWTGGQTLAVYNPDGPAVTPPERVAIVGKGEVSNLSNDYNQADRRVDLRVRVEPTTDGKGDEHELRDMKAEDFDLALPLTRETK